MIKKIFAFDMEINYNQHEAAWSNAKSIDKLEIFDALLAILFKFGYIINVMR